MKIQRLENYIEGRFILSETTSYRDVIDPATNHAISRVPLSLLSEVDSAVQIASRAFKEWRRVPVTNRVGYLFKLRNLLEQNIDDLARTITKECGKTYSESRAELERGLESIAEACGTPSLIQGYNNEDIAGDIDEHLFRQPLGVVAAITPFNFPGMIPLWFLPYAIACGNCFVLKPSERVPMTSSRLFELLHETGLPKGVAQLIHGDKQVVDALLDHPGIRAVSFVGSTPVAKYVYSRAAASGKRAQSNGGAKNAVVIMPDADFELTSKIVAESAFGCAGQRCLAASVAIAVGDAFPVFSEALADAASSRPVGYGLDDGVLMGPVISDQSKARIESLIEQGVAAGAELLVDGRGKKVQGYEDGHFVSPTVLLGGSPMAEAVRTEFFGPVLSLFRARSIREAIEQVNSSAFGNMASIFTQSGAAARQFRYQAEAGNIGVNIGVAAPMAPFPFSGWKESFFGDLHAQGRHAIEFYTETKVVVERWPTASN